MATSKLMQTPGIILKTLDYGESDLILTVYTEAAGKLSAFVPGAKRSKKRAAQGLDLFCEFSGDYHRRRGSSLYRLGNFTYLSIHHAIRTSLEKIQQATELIESINNLSADLDPHPALYKLLRQSLHTLEERPLTAEESFLVRFHILRIAGFAPQLNKCTDCARSIEKQSNYVFDVAHGGLLCPRCRQPIKPLSLTAGTVRSIQALLEKSSGKKTTSFTRQSGREAARLLDALIEYHSGRGFFSSRLREVTT